MADPADYFEYHSLKACDNVKSQLQLALWLFYVWQIRRSETQEGLQHVSDDNATNFMLLIPPKR
jgi:hypothetical protein